MKLPSMKFVSVNWRFRTQVRTQVVFVTWKKLENGEIKMKDKSRDFEPYVHLQIPAQLHRPAEPNWSDGSDDDEE